MLFDDESLPKMTNDEIRDKICDSLKQVVKDFVGEPVNNRDSCKILGHWIYVVPFIHRWDQPEVKDDSWLKLGLWKSNLRSRYLVQTLFYL